MKLPITLNEYDNHDCKLAIDHGCTTCDEWYEQKHHLHSTHEEVTKCALSFGPCWTKTKAGGYPNGYNLLN